MEDICSTKIDGGQVKLEAMCPNQHCYWLKSLNSFKEEGSNWENRLEFLLLRRTSLGS